MNPARPDAITPRRLGLARLATPIGEALLVSDETGLLRAFNWTDYQAQLRSWLSRRYPATPLTEEPAPSTLRAAFEGYFGGETSALGALRCEPVGTSFQLGVWQALTAIPAGETLSYAALAARIGRPTAMRAVGLANGANPIALVVPCHRVIGADGSLTGYGGGLHRKRWLLAHEGARFSDPLAA
jgi:methylated-DNA-[protein]-cysteine S-methyltransferase